jgi:TRAP-type transport system periplasmic protein
MKIFSVKLMFILTAVVIFFNFIYPVNVWADEVTLRFSTFFPASHPNSKLTEEYCKDIEKKTNGNVKTRHYAGGTLTPATQTYDGVVNGVADMGNIVLGYTMGKFPLSEVLDYPIGMPSGSVATRMMNAYYEKFKPKELDEVKVMFLHSVGPGNLHTRGKQVMSLEDLKGLKIRTYGPNAKMITMLGATPVAMPQGDAYDAISKGVVDGGLWAFEALEGWKIGEVVKYTTEIPLLSYGSVFVIVMNKGKWNSIAPADQKIIEKINKEYIEKQANLWDKIDESGKQFILKRGNIIKRLPAAEMNRWVKKVQPLYDEYVARMKSLGLPGAEVLKFAQDYLKAHRK